MPTYAATFLDRILENLTEILETNLNGHVAAIDGQLYQVASFDVPTEMTSIFPAVYVEPVGSLLDQSADDSRIDQEHELTIHLAITDVDFKNTRGNIAKYVIAVDRAIRRMSADDLLTDITSAVGAPVWEVTKHQYSGIFLNDQNLYRRDAALTVKIQFMER